jgi:hypothetical protein
MSFNAAISVGAELVSTWYSKRSSLMVPEGAITFCAVMALTTSDGDSPRACNASISRSTWIWRCLPP